MVRAIANSEVCSTPDVRCGIWPEDRQRRELMPRDVSQMSFTPPLLTKLSTRRTKKRLAWANFGEAFRQVYIRGVSLMQVEKVDKNDPCRMVVCDTYRDLKPVLLRRYGASSSKKKYYLQES